MNLQHIYNNLKNRAQISGQEINEQRLRQEAWMLRDRLMFQETYTGGSLKVTDNSINSFIDDDYIEDYFE